MCIDLADSCALTEVNGRWSIKSRRPRRQIFIRADIARLIRNFIDGQEISSCTEEQTDLLFTLAAKGYLDISLPRWDFAEYEVPFVSVIIPVKNRPEDIRDCLQSIFAVRWPKEKIEVLVVDDGSDDETPRVAESLGAHVIRRKTSGGPSAARNAGVAQARGEVLAFIDSDCTVDRTWLLELVPYLMAPGIGALGGFVASYYHQSPLDRYEEAMSSLSMGKRLLYEADTEGNFYVPTCNMLVRKTVYDAVGRLNPEMHLGEDVDLCWRIRGAGQGLLYIPRGRAWHKHRNALRQMLRRRLQYGTSEADLYQRHPEKKKVFPMPVLALGFWLGIFLTVTFWNLWFCLVIVVSFVLNMARKTFLIRRLQEQVNIVEVFQITWRTSTAFCYYLNFHFIRYYLILLLLVSMVYLPLLPAVLIAVVHCGIVDFRVKQPKMNYFSFLFFYLLEQISYQIGVLVGCFQHKYLKSYCVKLKLGF